MAEPVTAEDLEYAIDAMVDALRPVRDRDWHVRANDLEWDCWETVEHVADDLFSYATQLGPKPPPPTGYLPFGSVERRPGGPDETIHADPAGGNDGLLQVLRACGALLVAMVKTSPPDLRAYHGYGVCDRALARLFPAAPADTERWPTLLWATGRGEIPGYARLGTWRWDSTPHRD